MSNYTGLRIHEKMSIEELKQELNETFGDSLPGVLTDDIVKEFRDIINNESEIGGYTGDFSDIDYRDMFETAIINDYNKRKEDQG